MKEGELGQSYRHGIKPLALQGVPAIKCAYLVKDHGSTPPTLFEQKGLKEIPADLYNLRPFDQRVLLRTVSSLTSNS